MQQPASSQNHVARILREKAQVYCLQYDRGTPKAAYFFLKIDPLRTAAFHKIRNGNAAVASDTITEFGEVVASGWGEVPKRVREVMQEQYNITFDDE